MRFLFLLFLVSTSVNAQPKAVAINLDVKLLSNDSLFQGGTLQVNGLSVVPDFYVPIDSTGRYTIVFPKAGKYQLRFTDTTSNRQSFWMNPLEIKVHRKHNESITLGLQSCCYKNGQTAQIDFEQSQVIFYIYEGVVPSIYYPNLEFEEKYRVSFYTFGCIVDLLPECAFENNRVISQLMDEKYGVGWRAELHCNINGIDPLE